ncbi:MAG: T9SS type A sorting domain-containing protein [Sphingobacteriales bacterium]|nr:MAG: T9SS type A sorting domain-containing protein [Sphingobacteriales bacterium]
MNKNQNPFFRLVAIVCISLIFNGGGVNSLFAQIIPCTIPPPDACMLICNPDFSPPDPCASSIDVGDDQYVDLFDGYDYALNVFANPTECPGFEGWSNIFGTPDYNYPGLIGAGGYTPTDWTLVRMFSSAQNVTGEGCCQRTEGVRAETLLTAGNDYILTYLRESYNKYPDEVGPLGGSSCNSFGSSTSNILDLIHTRFTDDALISWPTSSININTPSQYQEVGLEQNINSSEPWTKVIHCFNATQNWNTLYIYPEQLPCNGKVALYLDRIELVPDDFSNVPTEVWLPCELANIGIDIGIDVCHAITDVGYEWAYWEESLQLWIALPETETVITVNPSQTTQYKLTRYIMENPLYPIIDNGDCIGKEVIITVTRPFCCEIDGVPPLPDIDTVDEMYCCLLDTDFTLTPDSPLATAYEPAQPNRIGYVAASGTWTESSNPFVTLGLINSGDDVLLDVDIVVPSGVTLILTNDLVIRFAHSRRIIIQTNGSLKLVGDNLLLTGLCNTVWQGIQVQGPGIDGVRQKTVGGITNYGYCEVSGQQPVIQHAIIGISGMEIPLMDVPTLASALLTLNSIFIPNGSGWTPTIKMVLLNTFTNSTLSHSTAGGVVAIQKRPLFDDCLVGINLSWFNNVKCDYPSSDPFNPTLPCEESYIYTADFFSTNLVFPFNILSTTVTTEAGVELLRYKNLVIGDDSYSANHNHFDNNKFAIRAIESDGLQIGGNDFEDCTSGVSISNGILNPVALGNDVSHNNFQNCTIGIQCGFTHIRITENNINPTAPPAANNLGIFLYGSSFLVESNQVSDVRVGAALLSNNDHNLVRLNTFTNNSLCVGLYGDNTGTDVVCNDFFQYSIMAMYSGNFVSFDPNYPSETGLLGDQGSCTALAPFPADNTFNVNSALYEIYSLNAANFFYYYRNTAPYIPQDRFNQGVTVTTQSCSSPVSIGENPLCMQGRSERSDEEIMAEPDERLRNREAKITADDYLHLQNDIEAALNLLEGINTDMGRRLLIPQYINDERYEDAQTLIDELPETQPEESNYKQISQIYKNMAQNGQHLLELNSEDEATVRQIAQGYTKSSFAARNLLLSLYGEEYALTLPSLDSLANVAISFKTQPLPLELNGLYPNPAKDAIHYDANVLPSSTVVNILIYNFQGQNIINYTAKGGDILNISADKLPVGMYFYQISHNGQIVIKDKLVLLK